MNQFLPSPPFLQELFPTFSGTNFEGFRGIKTVLRRTRANSAQASQFGI